MSSFANALTSKIFTQLALVVVGLFPFSASLAMASNETIKIWCDTSTRTDVGSLDLEASTIDNTLSYSGKYIFYKGNVAPIFIDGIISPVTSTDPYANRSSKVTTSWNGNVLTVQAKSWLSAGRAPHTESVTATFEQHSPASPYASLTSFFVNGKDAYPWGALCVLSGIPAKPALEL